MKKLRCKKGLTITEMLCVLVVVVLLSAILVTGVQFGVKFFASTVAQSEAKVLCSTLSAAVKDELRYAQFVTVENSGFTYTSGKVGNRAEIYVDPDSGYVMVANNSSTKLLIGKGAYTYGATADLNISFDQTTNIFTVELKIISPGEKTLAETRFQIKRLNSGIAKGEST